MKKGFTFILTEKDSCGGIKSLDKVFKSENYKYLMQSNQDIFPILSELELNDEDSYGPNFMPQLIRELTILLSKVKNLDWKEHIHQIIIMAEVCKRHKNMTLICTPFGEYYNNSI